ncbi:MAG: GxxExxY protein [bacterium]
MKRTDLIYKELCYGVVGAALEVHKNLGNGFLEAVYQEALSIELEAKNIPYEREKELKVKYKDRTLEKSYKADFVIDRKIIVETKTISKVTGVEEAKMINYLKCTGLRLGLIINFGAVSLEWKRIVN